MTYMGVLRSSSVKSCGKWVVSWKMSACSLMGAAAEPDCVFMIPKKKGRWKWGLPASKENSTASSVWGVVGRYGMMMLYVLMVVGTEVLESRNRYSSLSEES